VIVGIGLVTGPGFVWAKDGVTHIMQAEKVPAARVPREKARANTPPPPGISELSNSPKSVIATPNKPKIFA